MLDFKFIFEAFYRLKKNIDFFHVNTGLPFSLTCGENASRRT